MAEEDADEENEDEDGQGEGGHAPVAREQREQQPHRAAEAKDAPKKKNEEEEEERAETQAAVADDRRAPTVPAGTLDEPTILAMLQANDVAPEDARAYASTLFGNKANTALKLKALEKADLKELDFALGDIGVLLQAFRRMTIAPQATVAPDEPCADGEQTCVNPGVERRV